MSTMESLKGAASGKAGSQNDTPEQLLDVFKAAALSVTKLYKTSALAESRARTDGYQECLDDLLVFLDKDGAAMEEDARTRLRKWVTEGRDGRDARLQTVESEDEVDKAEVSSAPDAAQSNADTPIATQPRNGSMPPAITPINDLPTHHFIVPSRDDFTFQSSHPYPNIATLDLSDSIPHTVTSISSPRTAKARFNANGLRPGSRTSGHLGRGAGSKRRLDINEFFDGCLSGKDPFGNGGKRGRHS